MEGRERRIGILTGGGDCPGLNVVLRAVVKSLLLGPGIRTVGFRYGFAGLVEDDAEELDYEAVSGLLTRGGTILGTSNKANPFAWVEPDGTRRDRSADALAVAERHGLDGLVVVGGDGTMAIADRLAARGLPVIGVPKTIDNDLRGCELTFGFQTAVATATDAIDRIHDTAMSHQRVMVVEVMGRYAGWIALHAGVAGGADVLLIPEIPYSLDRIAERVEFRGRFGKRFTIVCVAEGAHAADGERVVRQTVADSPDPIRLGGIGEQLARQLEEATGREARATVLGHVQRGGTPIPTDRVLCTQFGHRAAELVTEGRWGQLVVWRGGSVTNTALSDAVGGPRLVPLDHPLLRAARDVGTSFGEP
jgi:6-phosphofructokinase 1